MFGTKPSGGETLKERSLAVVRNFEVLERISPSELTTVTVQVNLNERRLASKMLVEALQ